MKTTWIPRAALLSLISISAVLAGCGEVPSYDALSSDPSGDAPSNKDPGGVDPGHEGIDLDPSAGDVRHVPLDPGATPGSGAPGTKEVLTCVLIAPTTNGAVRDTSLVELDEQPHGQDGSAMTGHVGRARAQMLLRFELPIPKEGKVRSAVVTLHHVGNGTESVRVHRVTAPWSEDITWSAFDGAYDARVEASFTTAPGARTFGITSLTQAWVKGIVENDGLLLEQDPTSATQFRTSDWSDPSDRPTLEVCYEIFTQT